MGKKANILLFDLLVGVVSVVAAIMAVAAYLASSITPSESWDLSMLALGILPILGANVGLALYWILRKKWMFLLPVLAILINYSYLSAVLQVRFCKEESQTSLKIATYNVHGFRTTKVGRVRENIREFLKEENVDIVCFQEFMISEKIDLDSTNNLFSAFPYHTTIPNINDDLLLIIYSKFPISRQKQVTFNNSKNHFMWADLLVNGKELRVVNAHLQTTNISSSNKELAAISSNAISEEGRNAIDTVSNRLKSNNVKRMEQTAAILDVIRESSNPIIVCGDFNDTPSSYTYNTIQKELKDGFKSAGCGYMYTFKSFRKLLRIDYIFHNQSIKPIDYYSADIPYSDHNPVLFEFDIN